MTACHALDCLVLASSLLCTMGLRQRFVFLPGAQACDGAMPWVVPMPHLLHYQ